jgi:hypothetical protein
MFCPRCGSTQEEDVRGTNAYASPYVRRLMKFCKSCGANLYAVGQVIDTRETDKKLERSKPWFAEMAIYDAESRRRQEELDHQRGLTPEVRRFNEIKAGIITGTVGLGVMIFLYVFMHGLILSGHVSTDTAEILSRLWVAGVIPFGVGLALIMNGVFVSRRLAEVVRRAAQPISKVEENETNPLELRSAETTKFIPTSYSVTEDTTKHLKSHEPKR